MPYGNPAQRQVHPNKVHCNATAAFAYFCSLAPERRNIYAVAKKMRVPVQKIGQIAARDQWYKRITAIQSGVHEKLDRGMVDELAEANERHKKAARKLLERAVEAMESMQIERPSDVIAAVAKAIEAERLVLGASTAKVDVSLDEKISGEYHRWLKDRAQDAEFAEIPGAQEEERLALGPGASEGEPDPAGDQPPGAV